MGGLEDGKDGEVWYLVSEAIGCDETRPRTPSPSVEKRKPPFPPIQDEKASGPLSGQVEINEDDEKISHVGDPEKEEEKCWLRGMVIETLSKDQGWSSANRANSALYGMSSFSTSTSLISFIYYPLENTKADLGDRDIRSELFMVRSIPLTRWERSRGYSTVFSE